MAAWKPEGCKHHVASYTRLQIKINLNLTASAPAVCRHCSPVPQASGREAVGPWGRGAVGRATPRGKPVPHVSRALAGDGSPAASAERGARSAAPAARTRTARTRLASRRDLQGTVNDREQQAVRCSRPLACFLLVSGGVEPSGRRQLAPSPWR